MTIGCMTLWVVKSATRNAVPFTSRMVGNLLRVDFELIKHKTDARPRASVLCFEEWDSGISKGGGLGRR